MAGQQEAFLRDINKVEDNIVGIGVALLWLEKDVCVCVPLCVRVGAEKTHDRVESQIENWLGINDEKKMRKDSMKARNCLSGDLELEGGKGSCRVNFSKN